MQFFIVRSSFDLTRVFDYIRGLDLRRAHSIEVKEYRKNRSLAQNRLMWMWINEIAAHCGYNPEETCQAIEIPTPDDIHEMFKQRLLGTVRREILGDAYQVARSTTQLTTAEFTDYLSRIEQAARILQIVLTKPDDYNYAMCGG